MKYISDIISKLLEWSFKRTARKQFDKSMLKYRDSDNT
jgi:hypothetical protein